MKKYFLIFLFLPFVSFSQGVTYFVSNAGSNSNNGTSTSTPWQTLVKVRSALQSGGIVHAGDTIKFRKGDTFICQDAFNGCEIWGPPTGSAISGTANAQITWDAYGSGDAPNFLFPNPASTDTTSRNVLSFEGVKWYCIKNLQFNDTRRPNTKLGAAWTLGVVFGERGSGQETYNCKIENCFWNNCGNAVVIVGGTDSVINCTMQNFGNVFAIGSGSFGANGITFSGNHHYFAHNYITDAWAYSSAFGTNGGSLEAFNTCDSNKIIYNRFGDSGGVIEWGATASNSTCKDDTLAYNYVSNCGNFSYINVSAGFTVTPARIHVWNNTIIENNKSRWSGANYGDGIDTFPTWPSAESKILQNNGNPLANPTWDFQNNLVYNTNNFDVFTSNGIINHANNYLFAKGGTDWGYTPAGSEIKSSVVKIFIDTSNVNPILWNVHMPSLLNSGSVLITPDFVGQTVTNPATVGIYQSFGSGLQSNQIVLPKWFIFNGGAPKLIGTFTTH